MIGEALRLIRIFHDCKTSDLAKHISVSPSYISEIENGKKIPSLEIIEKYAHHFQLKVSSIIFFSEDLDSSPKNSVKTAIRAKLLKFLQIIEKKTE